LEYKSPDDYFSVYDFYKVLGYAFLYAALNRTAIEDLTLSIVEARHPRELLKYVKERGGTANETSPGIYRITGYPLAIQAIESRKLPLEENLWLKGLTKDLNAKTAVSILEESRKKGKEAEVAAYLYALINANIDTIQEALAMVKDGLPFDKWVEETGLAAKLRAEGKTEGEKAGWEKALAFLKQGHTVEELERMSPLVAKTAINNEQSERI
jgi:hypothetical protein